MAKGGQKYMTTELVYNQIILVVLHNITHDQAELFTKDIGRTWISEAFNNQQL